MQQKLGQYYLGSLIGEGIFTWVYQAFDEQLQRDVALKLLKPPWLNDPEAVQRFKQEAKVGTRFDHPNIADIYQVEEEEGQVYLIQYFVEGESLAARLERSPLAWQEMINVLYPVASALDYAHGQGVIHRDIKPANILLGNNGGVYLSDFGLVRTADGSAALASTSSGIAGAPPYMAPELWTGQKITSATDVYALSCVIVEMLTGHVLFDGTTPAAVRRQHLSQGPEFPTDWPADLPEGTIESLRWGLAHEAEQRPWSAGALAAVLAELTDSGQATGIPSLLPPATFDENPISPRIVENHPLLDQTLRHPLASSPEPQRKRFTLIRGLALGGAIMALTFLVCLSLYLFNVGRSVIAQSPVKPEPDLPTAEGPLETPSTATNGVTVTAEVIESNPTATATVVSEATADTLLTASPILTPTLTETPVGPEALVKGGYAKVIGTEGAGVSMRTGPGTNNARLSIVAEAGTVLILDGPRTDENQEAYVWWFVRDLGGNEGWVVEDFLEPALPPTSQ
jgi:serine/threonine-protein kinase